MNIFKTAYSLIADALFDGGKRPTAAGVKNLQDHDEKSLSERGILEWLRGATGKKELTGEVTYFTCLKLLSETLAKMPIKYYQLTDSGIVRLPPTDMSRLLCERPNPYMTPTVFWNTVELNRNHFGNAYVYIRNQFRRERYGGELKPLDMWIMPSDCVRILIDDSGYFAGRGKIWIHYTDRYSGEDFLFDYSDVFHFKTSFSFDGISGLPVSEILRHSLTGAIESQACMNSLYENGLTGKAVLEYVGELSPEKRDRLRTEMEKVSSGSENYGRIVPVPLGMKLTPLNIKLSDAQFLEIRKHDALRIAGAFGIKPNQINDYERSSYANSEMQHLSFLVETMLFILKQYEEEINYKGQSWLDRDAHKYYKFNEKVLLRTDSKTQMEILKGGVNNGIYNPNEARHNLDLPNAPGGEKLIVNGNYIPLEMVGMQYIREGAVSEQGDTE